MKRTLIVLMVVGLCSNFAFGQGLDLHEKHRLGAYLTFITITSKDIGKNTTPDAPKPGDVCGECFGKGFVGDGVTMLTCGACGGTGKVPGSSDEVSAAEVFEEMKSEGPSITEIRSGPDWNWSGRGNPPIQTKRSHLIKTHDVNPDAANKMTDQELEALHNLLHNSEVRASAPKSSCPSGNCPTSKPSSSAKSSSSCPSGNCPTSRSSSSSTRRYRLFGRRR